MTNEYLKTANILYVEDEENIREGYTKTLNRCAKKLYVAPDGQSGLDLFNENSIDIVITDIKMPNMSGIDMAKKIIEINPEIPIIFTTAHNEVNFLHEAINLQVDGYLLKPVPIKILMGKINKISKNIFLEKTNEIQQQRLFKIEKMAALGELIGNIAHQWRQPLSAISTGATGMEIQKEFGDLTDEFFFKTCSMIDKNAQYLSQTINDFSEIIKHNGKVEIFDLKDNIENFLTLVKTTIEDNNINVILDLQEDIKIDGYPNEFIQSFINMLNNSKDILNEMDENNKLVFITTYTDDNNIFIKFKDSGGGISDEILPKIFEPYFTTKHQSLGTGLGLHMTYNLIVNGMNGNIEAVNITYEYEGKSYTGAEFVITLPLG
ncbi:MAG: hybrid sensor histidine kinase/response regulator [Arcobacteraceae bacterium]|nr:hybrid sensor histidine kinase/response regulator [Arcobacteraceae bacterium]